MDQKSLKSVDNPDLGPNVPYRLYRWRFVGLVSMMLINIGGGLNVAWFGPIANDTSADYRISLGQVNWLSNLAQLVFIPMALMTPYTHKKIGMRNTTRAKYNLGGAVITLAISMTRSKCILASTLLITGSWIRFASTPHSLSPREAYALLVIGQIISSASQPMFITLGPKYSELWFDLKGRTTATMLISVCNPVGTAVAQIISPSVGSPNKSRESLLISAVVATALALPSLLIKSKPPTAPTYAGDLPSLGPMVTIRSMLCRERPSEKFMEPRDKLDFAVLMWGFGVYVGLTVAFSNLSSQVLAPYGYSDTISGLMGAALILSGLVAAIITSPLFDRVLTYHLALTLKATTPIISAAWFSLIWAVRENNTGALFALFVVIGVFSITLLPVTLELASEVTRNTATSSALLWAMGNSMSVIFIPVSDSLRAGASASPPLNLHRALIFTGACGISPAVLTQLMRGKQSRRRLDEEKNHWDLPNPAVSDSIDHSPSVDKDEARTTVPEFVNGNESRQIEELS